MTEVSLEQRVSSALDRGEHDAAVTDVVRTLGPEVLGFLHATAREEAIANEAFSRFCEDVWRGLKTFEHRASLRAWCYVVARRALHRTSRRERPVDRLTTGGAAQLADRVRTETLPYLRTGVRDGIRALREELDEDDRVLLTLRVDRGLAWRDLAEVFLQRDAEAGYEPTPEDLTKTAATLRKRFERIKGRIKRLARERGLVSSSD